MCIRVVFFIKMSLYFLNVFLVLWQTLHSDLSSKNNFNDLPAGLGLSVLLKELETP